ncbi:hypothetical protein LCGC14_2065380, partial [marine sediment metagenome]
PRGTVETAPAGGKWYNDPDTKQRERIRKMRMMQKIRAKLSKERAKKRSKGSGSGRSRRSGFYQGATEHYAHGPKPAGFDRGYRKAGRRVPKYIRVPRPVRGVGTKEEFATRRKLTAKMNTQTAPTPEEVRTTTYRPKFDTSHMKLKGSLMPKGKLRIPGDPAKKYTGPRAQRPTGSDQPQKRGTIIKPPTSGRNVGFVRGGERTLTKTFKSERIDGIKRKVGLKMNLSKPTPKQVGSYPKAQRPGYKTYLAYGGQPRGEVHNKDHV